MKTGDSYPTGMVKRKLCATKSDMQSSHLCMCVFVCICACVQLKAYF